MCDDTCKTPVYFGELVGGTVDDVHDTVCGTVINDELLAGQHGGPQINEAELDFMSVCGPAGRLFPESTKA